VALKKIVACFIITIVFLVAAFPSSAQTDSCKLRISLLTCSPGEELYSTFGHTAIRVIDSTTGVDLAFNYGTFDIQDPNKFYADFTRGLMLYSLSVSTFTNFMPEYVVEQRGVIEQVLQLSCEEKHALFNALQENMQEQNRSYYYHFHTDNCTTRARDIVRKITAKDVAFKNILPAKIPTFRNLLHSYLDKGHEPWSKFGIDLLLGAPLDEKVNNETAMFLPDYLMMGFDSATVAGQPLVGEKRTILAPTKPEESGSWFTPLVLFTTLWIFITLLSVVKPRWSGTFLRIFDISFFLLLGLLGLLLVVLWVIRVDTVCRDNYNLLWALPTHIIAAFFTSGKKAWARTYFKIVCIITLLTAATWFLLPQQLNTAVAPILGLILVRAYYLTKKKR